MAGSQRKFTIGREPTCDVALPNDTVSAVHAELHALAEGRLLLIDCKSRNGTFRLLPDGGEARVHQELVSPFDRVRFGEVRLGVRELLQALRLKRPGFDAAAPPPGPPPRPAPSAPAGARERCDCGAIKPVGQPCPVCHR